VYNSHLNVYRLGDATHALRQNSRTVYSAVKWNDIDSTPCAPASRKASRLDTTQKHQRGATRPMMRVFIILQGGARLEVCRTTCTGCKYFLMITDGATRFRLIFFFLTDPSRFLKMLVKLEVKDTLPQRLSMRYAPTRLRNLYLKVSDWN
jgi:hypothetical protein